MMYFYNTTTGQLESFLTSLGIKRYSMYGEHTVDGDKWSNGVNTPDGRFYIGALDGNCGMGLIHSLFPTITKEYYNGSIAFSKRLADLQDQRVRLIADACFLLKKANYGIALYGVNSGQKEIIQALQKSGFKVQYEFKSPRTGSICTMYGLDLVNNDFKPGDQI